MTPGPTEDEPPKPAPQPVTVEDEPEKASESSITSSPAPLPQLKNEVEPEPEVMTEATHMLRDFEERVARLSLARQAATTTRQAPPAESSQDTLEAALAKLVNEREGLHQEVNRQLSNLSTYTSRLYQPTEAPVEPPINAPSSAWREYRVCCNHCEQTIPDAHYHCTKCDDDDFDLCLACVDSGVTCYGSDHWLIKRFKRNGVFVTSTTEKIPPKPKVKEVKAKDVSPLPRLPVLSTASLGQQIPVRVFPSEPVPAFTRTCNCCVQGMCYRTREIHMT